MEAKMYVFYLKSDKVVEVIGDRYYIEDRDINPYVNVYRNDKFQAKFMLDSIEGFITKEVTENDTRKE